MKTLIAESTDIGKMTIEEEHLPPGNYEVCFHIWEPITRSDVTAYRRYLAAEGVRLRGITQRKADGLWHLAVQYEKPEANPQIAALPLAVIPLVAFTMVAILVGVGIFKLEDISSNVGKLLLITFGGIIVVAALARQPAMKYLEKA